MNSQGATGFEPSIEWVHEDDCDTLLLYLPGFVKEQLKVQLRSKTLIISGQRKLHDNTISQFWKEFTVTEHCDITKINAKFEGSILYVKQPKTTTQVPKQEPKTPTDAPTPVPKNPTDEPKAHQDTKPTLLTKPNGNSEEKIGELKDPKGVCENASMKLKPSRKDVIKVLIVVVGVVVGVYWTKLVQSWMG